MLAVVIVVALFVHSCNILIERNILFSFKLLRFSLFLKDLFSQTVKTHMKHKDMQHFTKTCTVCFNQKHLQGLKHMLIWKFRDMYTYQLPFILTAALHVA